MSGGFGVPRRSYAGPKFYLALLALLAVVYLLVWLWVLRQAPEAVPAFVSFALGIGLPLLGLGVGALLLWIWLSRKYT